MSDMACLCLWCHVRHGIRTLLPDCLASKQPHRLPAAQPGIKNHIVIAYTSCPWPSKNIKETVKVLRYFPNDICEKIRVLPNAPVVVNKGVQGVYGALYFLSVSSGGSEPGSEGQEGSANTLFHTVEPIRMSCRLILKPSSNPEKTLSVKVHELDASSFLSFELSTDHTHTLHTLSAPEFDFVVSFSSLPVQCTANICVEASGWSWENHKDRI